MSRVGATRADRKERTMKKEQKANARPSLRTNVRAGDNPGMGPYAAEVRSRTIYIIPEERPIPT